MYSLLWFVEDTLFSVLHVKACCGIFPICILFHGAYFSFRIVFPLSLYARSLFLYSSSILFPCSCWRCSSSFCILYLHLLALHVALRVEMFEMICHSRRHDVCIILMIFLMLGKSWPCIFRGICELFAMSRIVVSTSLFRLLERNVCGIGAVMVPQNRAGIFPINICCMVVAMRKQE